MTIYCSLAFGAISITPSKNYLPCCGLVPGELSDKNDTLLSPNLRINDNQLIKLRQSLIDGVWPSACKNCKVQEDLGIKSMRNGWNFRFPNLPLKSILEPEDVTYLDLNLGNKCNSKCMTCNPMSSDFWADEQKFIFGFNNVKNEYLSADVIDYFPNLSVISFLGGEPTINDEHVVILDRLIKSGRSKNMHLTYVTNLTGISDELLSLWDQFGSVGLSMSIDGVGKINEYIRYPMSWEKISTTLKKYLEHSIKNPKLTYSLSATVSMLNILNVHELLNYWLDINLEIKGEATTAGSSLNRVYTPNFLNLNLLTNEYRESILQDIQVVKTKATKYNAYQIVENLSLLEAWLKEPRVIDTVELDTTIHFISKSDQFRNRNINDYIPNLWDEIWKIKQSS